MENDDLYYRIIKQTDDTQIRLSIHEFRGIEYIGIREYYQDFDGIWCPGKKGITIELSIPVTRELFAGLVEILSLAESKALLELEFKEVLDNIYDVHG